MALPVFTAAAGAAIASVVGLILGHPSLVFPAVILAVGILVAAAISPARQVSMLDAAEFADSRLNLKDLLSTAWTISEGRVGGDVEWNRSIFAQAESRCAAIDLKQLKLPVVSARLWSAAILTAMLALTLGMIHPVAGNPAAITALASAQQLPADAAAVNTSTSPQFRPAGDTVLDESSDRPGAPGSSEPGDQTAAGHPGDSAQADGASPGAAAGISRTNVEINLQNPAVSLSGVSKSDSNGRTAGGGGTSSEPGRGTAPLGTAGSMAVRHAPAWQGGQSSQSGQIPTPSQTRLDPAFSDILRDYFRRS